MIKIRNYEVKNTLEELTINEYGLLTECLNSKKNSLDKFIDAIIICGLKDEETLSELSLVELKEFISSLSLAEVGSKLQRTIEMNGREYEAYKVGEPFVFSAKALAYMQNVIQNKQFRFMDDLCAIIFKDVELTYKEHFTDAHIKHKRSLFSDLPASIIVPYVSLLMVEIASQAKSKEEEAEIAKMLEENEEIENSK